jgi:hypothetical protein
MDVVLQTFTRNAGAKSVHGYRFRSRLLKDFAWALRYLSGRKAYLFFTQNVPGCFPSLKRKPKDFVAWTPEFGVTERNLRVALDYFERSHYTGPFSLAFDSTAVTPCLSWNPRNNGIVGLASCDAPSFGTFREVAALCKRAHLASSIEFFLAVPTSADLPAFPIGMFPTDGHTTAKRTTAIIESARKMAALMGLMFVADGADGDESQLAAQRDNMTRAIGAGVPRFQSTFLGGKLAVAFPARDAAFPQGAKTSYPEVSFQDPIHIGKKLKNRLYLPEEKSMMIGEWRVTIGHYKKLVSTGRESSLRCGIRESEDLAGNDRQNFKSCLRLWGPEALAGLRSSVEESRGTELFMRQARNFVMAFLDRKPTIVDRLESMWEAIFFFMLWDESENFLRSDAKRAANVSWRNRISTNAFRGMELCGRSFIQLVLFFAEALPDTPLLPWKLGSQPVEEFFRVLRMPDSRLSAQVTFSVLECQRRATSVLYMEALCASHSADFQVPRHYKTCGQECWRPSAAEWDVGHLLCKGISSEAIDAALLRARDRAASVLAVLGVMTCRADVIARSETIAEEAEDSDPEWSEMSDTDMSDDDEDEAEHTTISRYVDVPKKGPVHKEKVLRLLADRMKASSDRTRRVRHMRVRKSVSK